MTIFDFLTAGVVVSVVMYGLYKMIKLDIQYRKEIEDKKWNMFTSIKESLDIIDSKLYCIFENQIKQSDD